MVLYPNAKVNIGLHVTAERPDGYHNIDSIVYPIPLKDTLNITPANSFKLTAENANPDQLSLLKDAYELICNQFGIPPVHIHIVKNIPIGAGLGGGSSDAAFCLKGLSELFNLNISTEQLECFALELGSDCPFFIKNTVQRVAGRGEKLEDTNFTLKNKYIKLILPPVHISTKEAFDNCIPKNRTLSTDTWSFTNDFEKWAFSKYPLLNELKTRLINEGAKYASMTGTGSAIYGIYDRDPGISQSNIREEVMRLE